MPSIFCLKNVPEERITNYDVKRDLLRAGSISSDFCIVQELLLNEHQVHLGLKGVRNESTWPLMLGVIPISGSI